MLKQLGIVQIPAWLADLRADTIECGALPLDDILRDSLYYPSSGFDGTPIRYLAGNVHSFVYVDYGQGREDLDRALRSPGFRGYGVLGKRDVPQVELTPHGWTPTVPTSVDGNPTRYRNWMKKPFCLWIVFQRLDEFPESHGPHRFSLLYLCADGVAAFQALYVANKHAPAIVAVIQPGHAFGGNWTDFTDPQKIFARSVLQNPAGKPRIFLYGGIGRRDFYRNSCWPNYNRLVSFLEKAGCGTIGVWAHASQLAPYRLLEDDGNKLSPPPKYRC